MYRKDMVVDGTEYKIGKSRKLGYNLVCKSNRYLGHSRSGIVQRLAPYVLLWRSRLPHGVRCDAQGDLLEHAQVVWGDAQPGTSHPLHLHREQN